MSMSSIIVRSWFVVPGGVRVHSDVINDSSLMVVFLVVRVSVVRGRSWPFVVVPGGVPGHSDVINDSQL